MMQDSGSSKPQIAEDGLMQLTAGLTAGWMMEKHMEDSAGEGQQQSRMGHMEPCGRAAAAHIN